MGLRRDIDPALVAAISRSVWYPILFVHLDWPGSAIRAHSGVGSITFDGHVWSGVGRLGSISSETESVGLTAASVTLEMTGLPPEVLEEAQQPIRNHPGEIYIGATTEAAGNVLIGQPYLFVSGYMDALRCTVRRENGDVEHGVQIDLGVGPSARAVAAVLHSAEDQGAKYPGDTAGRHLIEVEARTQVLRWPED